MSATNTNTLSSFPSASASPSPAVTSGNPNNNNNNNNNTNNGGAPASFYKNLFYILIGLLCAFGLVSFLSLMRARRRRATILREAERLGVLVPGVPGYIPMRERSLMQWTRADGTEAPEWWEVEKEKKPDENAMDASTGRAEDDSVPAASDIAFNPLGVVPPIENIKHEPPPASTIPYFPNHLAYRPESLIPPPSRYQADNLSSLDALGGERVEVLTIIKMPTEAWPEGREVQEEEEVIKEWSGIELGITKMDVGSLNR